MALFSPFSFLLSLFSVLLLLLCGWLDAFLPFLPFLALKAVFYSFCLTQNTQNTQKTHAYACVYHPEWKHCETCALCVLFPSVVCYAWSVSYSLWSWATRVLCFLCAKIPSHSPLLLGQSPLWQIALFSPFLFSLFSFLCTVIFFAHRIHKIHRKRTLTLAFTIRKGSTAKHVRSVCYFLRSCATRVLCLLCAKIPNHSPLLLGQSPLWLLAMADGLGTSSTMAIRFLLSPFIFPLSSVLCSFAAAPNC